MVSLGYMTLSRLWSHPCFAVFAVQLLLAYEWLLSGWEKIHGGQFAAGIGKTLTRFEGGNPHTWYVDSVLRFAQAHPSVFAVLVQWGELFVGIGLVVAMAAYLLSTQAYAKKMARVLAMSALIGGVFMSLNFYFAAGWTSPSTGGLNALMFWMQIIVLLAWSTLIRKNSVV